MQTISINLPDTLGDFVQRQSAEHGVDEYFERILRDQQREQARDRLEAELIKGIESGPGEPITPEFWQEVREEARRRNAAEKETLKKGASA
jgi:antitoxin ParD1/3/4